LKECYNKHLFLVEILIKRPNPKSPIQNPKSNTLLASSISDEARKPKGGKQIGK
jgi:hypothetical protein